MDIRNVPLNDLVLDPNLNLRDRLDDFTVERYADSWDRLPPITVYEVDGKWLVADGFHRHAAAVMLGKRSIPAEIVVGSFTDALDFVASVNLFHGLPLTRSERRRAVELKLKLHHDWSDRRMSEELAVSRELVAKIRRQLIEGSQIPNNPGRVGSDGKLYTSAGIPREQPERPKGRAGRRGRQRRARPPRNGRGGGSSTGGDRNCQGQRQGRPGRRDPLARWTRSEDSRFRGPRPCLGAHDRRTARADVPSDHASDHLDPGGWVRG